LKLIPKDLTKPETVFVCFKNVLATVLLGLVNGIVAGVFLFLDRHLSLRAVHPAIHPAHQQNCQNMKHKRFLNRLTTEKQIQMENTRLQHPCAALHTSVTTYEPAKPTIKSNDFQKRFQNPKHYLKKNVRIWTILLPLPRGPFNPTPET